MYDFDKPRGLSINIERASKIDKHLRIPTLPVGLKFFKKDEFVPKELGRESDWVGTFCQFLKGCGS